MTLKPPPLTPAESTALAAVLDGPAQTASVASAPRYVPADPNPDAATLLASVPRDKRSIVQGYLGSRMPQDEARGRELAEQYDLDYSAIRRAWGVEPIGLDIEVVGVDGITRRARI